MDESCKKYGAKKDTNTNDDCIYVNFKNSKAHLWC